MIVSESILRNKSKEFAKQIVYMCRDIKANARESVLTNQLLRSGTSIGANIHEAQYAQGKKDFISKLEIAQKECFETEYWLELLFETGYISCFKKKFQPIFSFKALFLCYFQLGDKILFTLRILCFVNICTYTCSRTQKLIS